CRIGGGCVLVMVMTPTIGDDPFGNLQASDGSAGSPSVSEVDRPGDPAADEHRDGQLGHAGPPHERRAKIDRAAPPAPPEGGPRPGGVAQVAPPSGACVHPGDVEA